MVKNFTADSAHDLILGDVDEIVLRISKGAPGQPPAGEIIVVGARFTMRFTDGATEQKILPPIANAAFSSKLATAVKDVRDEVFATVQARIAGATRRSEV